MLTAEQLVVIWAVYLVSLMAALTEQQLETPTDTE